MKTISTLLLALLCLTAAGQNYNNFVLATNAVPVQFTNTVVSSNLYCISRTATLWVTVQPVTNNPTVTMGTGSFAVAVGGSPYLNNGPLTNVNYYGSAGSNTTCVYSNVAYVLISTNTTTTLNNVLTIPYNGTNPVTGYITFDASQFATLQILNMQNQSTNLIATNITANIIWR